MAGALVSTVSDMLKYRYLGPLRTQVNNEVAVSQILKLDSKRIDLDGLKAVVPLHYGRSSGVGARREDEDLPAAGNQKYKTAEFDLAYLYGRARFTGQAIQKTKTDAGAFIRVITDELDRLRDDLTLDNARQYYGDGTAVIASVPLAVTAGTDLVLDSAEAIDKGFLHIGMLVDIGTVAAPTGSASAVEIADVDPATKTVTMTANVTTSAGDKIFRAGNADASGSKEITAGLSALISSSANTVGGIDSSTAGLKWWKNGVDSTGGSIALNPLMVALNKTIGAGAKLRDLIALTTPGLARRLFASADFKDNIRFSESAQLDGGFEKITFATSVGRMTLLTDRLAPYGAVRLVDTSSIKVYSPGDWDFLARDGLTVRWVDNRDAFQAVLFRYVNLGTNRRNSSFLLNGFTDDGF